MVENNKLEKGSEKGDFFVCLFLDATEYCLLLRRILSTLVSTINSDLGRKVTGWEIRIPVCLTVATAVAATIVVF